MCVQLEVDRRRHQVGWVIVLTLSRTLVDAVAPRRRATHGRQCHAVRATAVKQAHLAVHCLMILLILMQWIYWKECEEITYSLCILFQLMIVALQYPVPRIVLLHFLAGCCKRQLNRSFVVLCLSLLVFLPRCMECSRGIAMGILSVRPSVRLSVCQTCALWQNGRKLSPYFYTTR